MIIVLFIVGTHIILYMRGDSVDSEQDERK